MSSTLPVSEIFGPTIQGEGPFSGRVCSFIRLGGCNLACTWCDSAFTWDAKRYDLRKELTQLEPDDILNQLPAVSPIVVITGGEPLMYAHREAFRTLLEGIRTRGAAIHIESNGTHFPPPDVDDLVAVYVLSPKLENAGAYHRVSTALHADWPAIAQNRPVFLKFVCQSAADVEEAAEQATSYGFARESVWVMPEGSDIGSISSRFREIAETAIDLGVNVTSRLHILAWGDERGR